MPTLFAQFDDFDITIERDVFLIHSTRNDSSNAVLASEILAKGFDEIAFDLGVDKNSQFQVYVMPTRKSFRDAIRGELPKWTGAFAVPAQNLMVIKSPRWDQSRNYEQVLIHELTHLVVHDIIGARHLPRWLDEGMAIFYSGEDHWKTDRAVSKALTTGSILPLDEIDDVLEYHRAKADLAYQQSFSATRYLLATYDTEALREIIYNLKEGTNLNAAFVRATGSSLDEFEKEWRVFIKNTHRWFWLYEINDYVWGLIIVLAIVAFIIRKIRNRRVENDWQDDLPEHGIDEPFDS